MSFSYIPNIYLNTNKIINFGGVLILVCAISVCFPLDSKAHQEDVRRRFRPIEKLKEEFRELNLQLETDFEIMFKLINKFNSSTSTLEEKITALHDLEYYVHQVRRFFKINIGSWCAMFREHGILKIDFLQYQMLQNCGTQLLHTRHFT